jgi:hypothetical protein
LREMGLLESWEGWELGGSWVGDEGVGDVASLY